MSVPESLIDFLPGTDHRWSAVNDGVMGGISQGGMRITEEGTGEFSGVLSLAYNGGFASARTALKKSDWSAYTGVALRIKGDGRSYQVRLRTDGQFIGVAYRAVFATEQDRWLTVRIEFADFEPTYRGRVLKDQPALNTANLTQLAFMLADKQAGPFRLEIQGVWAWSAEEKES